MNEAFRESEEFKNNVNEKLNSENRVLVRDFNVLERQYEDTEVSTKTKDVVTVVSSLQTGDFEAKTGQDLTYLLSVKEWEEYYEKNLEFLRKKLGKTLIAFMLLFITMKARHICIAFGLLRKKTTRKTMK